MKWINENKDLFLANIPNSILILKGIKKTGYSLFKEYIDYNDYYFSNYELEIIATKNSLEYDNEQLISIYINPRNMNQLLGINNFSLLFIQILNLNIDSITDVYLSSEFQSKLRNMNKLKDVYYYIDKLRCNHERLLFIPDNLQTIGEKVNLDEQWLNLLGKKYRSCSNYSYNYFFIRVKNFGNKELTFKILDYYLINYKYLTCFQLQKDRLKKEILEEYYESRKELITTIINESNSKELYKIFSGLDEERIKKEITKDRECLIYGLNYESLSEIFLYKLKGTYKLDEKALDIDRFISIFSDCCTYNLEATLNSIIVSEKLKKKIKDGIMRMLQIKTNTLKALDDSEDDFRTYLKIISLSSYGELLNKNYLTFLNDMKILVFCEDYKSSLVLYDKYQNVDLKKIKLEILEEIKNRSRSSIISSLTNISEFETVEEDYYIDDKKYTISVIYFNGQPYQFMVRRLSSGNHFFDGTYQEKDECYSTIYEESRSVFYGNIGIICGYSNILPEDIIYMYPFDAISNNFKERKYVPKTLKIPKWLSSEDMNRITKANKSYNELRVFGKYIPDFVISYDDPNNQTIKYAGEHNVPMIKIIRKKYPNSIEFFDDPYKNWQ